MELNNVASHREFLKTMPTQELDAMIQAELRKENIDDALVRLILDVLEEREADYPAETNEGIATAVEKYATYLDGLEATPVKPARRWSVVLKVASVLVVIGLLLFTMPQAVHAESFFEMLARWTDSVFEFFSPGDDKKQPEYVFKTDHPGLQQIYDAVVELGITEPVVPMWVPDGFVLENVKVIEQPSELMLLAKMVYQDRRIQIAIIEKNSGIHFDHMKDSRDIEIFEIAGIKHYVISNNEPLNTTWIINNIECSVVTDCQEDDLNRILESIYTTED